MSVSSPQAIQEDHVENLRVLDQIGKRDASDGGEENECPDENTVGANQHRTTSGL
jgi:hypothetical protein